MNKLPELTEFRFVKGATQTFLVIIAALLAYLVIGAGAIPVGDPVFLTAVPTFIVLSAVLIDMRHEVLPHHGAILVWTAVGATWLLSLLSQYLGAFDPPVAAALAILLGVIMLPKRQFLALLAINLVAGAALGIAFSPSPDERQATVLFILALTVTAYFMWKVLDGERERRAQLTVQSANQRDALRDILDSTQDFIVTLDPLGGVVISNQAAKTWINENFDRPLNAGLPLRTIIPKHLRAEFDDRIRCCEDGEPAAWAFEKKTEGEVHSFQVSFAPLKSEQGIILCGRDMTAMHALRERVGAAEINARQLILNRVSHDISTPLTPILLTTARFLGRDGIDADFEKALHMIQRNVRRAVEAVQEIVAENSRANGESLAALDYSSPRAPPSEVHQP